jgi:hypothetical protein
VNAHVETYRWARKAKRIDAAAAELIKIRDLVSDSEDYRHQKAKILFGQLSRKDSQ